MSAWIDVMRARGLADAEAQSVAEYPGNTTTNPLVHALLALRLEVRALAVSLDYAIGGERVYD